MDALTLSLPEIAELIDARLHDSAAPARTQIILSILKNHVQPMINDAITDALEENQ